MSRFCNEISRHRHSIIIFNLDIEHKKLHTEVQRQPEADFNAARVGQGSSLGKTRAAKLGGGGPGTEIIHSTVLQ